MKSLKIAGWVIAILLAYGVLNGIVLGLSAVSTSSTSGQDVPDIEVAKDFFGFESGKEYPLDMGQQVSNFNLSATGGWFYVNISASTTQDVEVTFMHGNEAYLVRLPLEGANRARILIDNSKPASMKIDMQDTDYYGRTNTSAGVNYSSVHPDCTFKFYGVFVCTRPGVHISDQLSDPHGVRDKGLQGLLENDSDLKGAVLTMPQSMYDQLVGHISPAAPATPAVPAR